MADRGKIPKKKDKLAGTTSIKPPGDAMHAAQAKNRKPEQQGAFSSGSSPAKASGGWHSRIQPTGTKPKDGGGPRTTAADKRKAQETHRPGSAKAEKKPRAAPKPAAAPLKFTNVSAAETKPKAPKAPKPAKNYPDFDDDDDAPPASPGKPADVLAELRGDSDDDDAVLGAAKPEKSNADVLAELGGDSDGDDVLGETPGAAAASDSEEDSDDVDALMERKHPKKKVEKKRNASPPPKKKPAAKKKPAVNPFNFDSDDGDDATPAAAPEPLLDAAADDDDDDDLFASPAASSPRGRSRTPAAKAPAKKSRSGARKKKADDDASSAASSPRPSAKKSRSGARKKKTDDDASSSSSPRPAKKSRSGARKPKAAASDDDDDDYEEASPRSPRKKAARKDGKRKSGGAGAPAKKKPKAPSSSSGSDSEEPLDDFFWKERDGEKVAATRRMAAVAAPSRECPHAAVAPGALASIEKYAVPSSALVWVKVGRSFYYDGRKQSGDQRPGYVLPAAELEDLGIPKPVGGEHMRVVRLFDDHAFVPWDGPKAVRASETKDFGSGRSSNYWEKGKVRTLEKDCAPVEFTHVFTLGAEAALRLAFEHDRAQGAALDPPAALDADIVAAARSRSARRRHAHRADPVRAERAAGPSSNRAAF
ncbi:hypothetical protein SO694_00141080 [Aureococcus anophagefferens]|uniref:Uncharacterized protein n=1 Tax=Aureococcus anophagefferens TaxID=44056 RepID=A0ABR1FPJ6_AURAN